MEPMPRSGPLPNRQKKAKKAVDTIAAVPYFGCRSYWAGL
jgi:hypothetical protein